MSFSVDWQGLEELRARFDRLPGQTRQRVRQVVRDMSELVAQTARANMARLFKGPVAEITTQVTESGEVVTGTITAGGTVYARIHEYGGTVHLPEIFPVHAQALHWVTKGGIRLQSFWAPPQPASRRAHKRVERHCERPPSPVLDAVIRLEPHVI